MTSVWKNFLMSIVLTLKNSAVCHNEDFDKRVVLHYITKKYENHSNIIKIKNNISVKSQVSPNNTFTFSKTSNFQWSKFNSKISQHQKGIW